MAKFSLSQGTYSSFPGKRTQPLKGFWLYLGNFTLRTGHSMPRKEIPGQVQMFCPQKDKQMLEMTKLSLVSHYCCFALTRFQKDSPLVFISFFPLSLMSHFSGRDLLQVLVSAFVFQDSFSTNTKSCCCRFIPSPGSYELPRQV